MARTNGPIQVWNNQDTVPTDGQGGYGGGDSTAAALALAGGQAQAALTTMENLKVAVNPLPVGATPTASISGTVPQRTITFNIPEGKPGMGYEQGQQLTAAAQAASDAAVTAAAGVKAVGSLRDSTTAGLLDYTTAEDSTPTTPQPVTLLSDGFNRTGELVGTTPATGPAWTGTSGRWSGNGSVAAASGAGALLADIARLDATVTAVLSLVTTGTGASQLARIYLGANGAAVTAGVWAAITINGTGTASAALWKTIGGTSTQLATCPVTLTPNSATPQTVTVTLTVAGTTVTMNAGASDATATITDTDRAALSTRAGLYAAGAIPGITVDSITATRPGDPITPAPSGQIVTATPDGALPAVVLSALDARYSAGGGSVLEQLRLLRDFGSGIVNVAIVSDSTGNDPNDWVRIWVQKWGATLPATVRRTYRSWDAAVPAWRTTTVDNAAAAPDRGVIVDDDMSTSGEVVGSSPDTGPAWAGSTAPGWTSNGQVATLGGSAQKVISTNLASRDQTVRVTFAVTTTAQAAAQLVRVYAGSAGSGLNSGVWASLSVSTAGSVTVALYKTIGGTTTTLAASAAVAGVTANSGSAQTVTVEVTTAIQQAKAVVTAGGQSTTVTGTITEADVAALGNYAGILGVPASAYTYAWAIDAVHAHTPAYDAPIQPPTLAVHNAAVAGWSSRHYDTATRAAMFGSQDISALILAFGHNNGAQTPAAFIAEVSAWLDAWRAEHPGCAVLVVSQNPQVSPSAGIASHRDRQAAIRSWAKARGLDYLGVFEEFAKRGDGGASLIQSDGVHPTVPAVGTLTGAYGSVLWADTMTAAI